MGLDNEYENKSKMEQKKGQVRIIKVPESNEKTQKVVKKALKVQKKSKEGTVPPNTPTNSTISISPTNPMEDQVLINKILQEETTFVSGILNDAPTHIEGDKWFKSRTQYDTCFNQAFEEYQNKSRGMVCPIFVLCMAKSYFVDHDILQEKYEENLEKAITITTMLSITKQKLFEELIRNTNLNVNQIVKTNINDINLANIFTEKSKDQCAIFLKNSKYWIVISDSKTGTYCIRDCHETYQHNFNDLTKFLNFLTTKYSMKTEFVIDGYVFSEYSNIEYITITSPFTDTFDRQINDIFQSQDPMNIDKDDQPFIKYIDPGTGPIDPADNHEYYSDSESNLYSGSDADADSDANDASTDTDTNTYDQESEYQRIVRKMWR